MRVLMFGATGQLAREMLARAPAADIDVIALSRAEVDLTDIAAVERAIAETPDIDLVVNAAAYTAVDRAESDRETAFKVNGEAPGAMARAAAARALPFIHVSTDYVFNGERDGAWRETDTPDPIGVYGASKLAGEQAIAAAGGRHVILRTAWVFSPYGGNFVKTMRRLAKDRPELKVVNDQWGCPTAAGDIADFILASAPRWVAGEEPDLFGLFHFSGEGRTNWRDFAETIIGLGPEPRPVVTGIPTTEYPTPARRPYNSELDTSRLRMIYGYGPRPWRDGLNEALATLEQQEREG